MSKHPLDVFKRIDPEFFRHVNDTREFALSDGALPGKFKFLIAMAQVPHIRPDERLQNCSKVVDMQSYL